MNVALLGFGIVGKGVYDLLIKNHPAIHVTSILECNDELLTNLMHLKASSFEEILNDKSIAVVIELIGGKDAAYTYVKAALAAGKHVVTANKALISAYYKELHDLAASHDVNLLYEASVGGAMIVLDPLRTIRDANPIQRIQGIINGSTNVVLSHIFLKNASLKSARDEAFKLGYLETGSTDDMDGFDLMRKINILSMLAYKTYIAESAILNMPLSRLSKALIDDVKKHHHVLKYVAFSKRVDQHIDIYVTPMIVAKDHIYHTVNEAYNMVELYGSYHEKQTFVGQGAGRYPTATAVVYDLLNVNKNKYRESYDTVYHINAHPINQNFLVQFKAGSIKKMFTSLQHIIKDEHILCAALIGENCYED